MIIGKMNFEFTTIMFKEENGHYHVEVKDEHSRETGVFECSHQQMGAVMHLLFGPPEGRLEEMLYEIAEPVMEGLSIELRLIP